jgi:hypothetical protein
MWKTKFNTKFVLKYASAVLSACGQVAAACNQMEMVSLLLSHGAHPFLSTLLKDSLCYSGAAQRGSYR